MSHITDILTRLLSRGEIPGAFLDVGAHFGETNDYIRSIFPDRPILSFEANPNCEPILREKGISYKICLLGRKNKAEVPFLLDPNDSTSTGCSVHKELTTSYFENANVIKLPMYRLDDLVNITADSSKDVFLKMDVQGSELEVLDGATELIPWIKWIYLEVSFIPCNEGSPLFDDVFKHLDSLGYRVQDLCDFTYLNNELAQGNILFVRK